MIRPVKRFWFKASMAGLVFIVSLIICLLVIAYRYPEKVLTVDSGEIKGDVIIVLGGFPYRALYAAHLYHKSVAPFILVTGRGDTISNIQYLLQAGVPGNVILEENESNNTYENALYSIPILRRMGARRVIIVTSWYHSRRALGCFQHLAPDMIFLSRPYLSQEDGVKEMESNQALAEYLKIVDYWICYGISPLTN